VRHLERLEAALTAWTDEDRAPTAETLAYSAGVPARICEVLLSDLEEVGSVERDQDGGVAIVVPPETFKTGVRDLVTKLKTFRYEGERRLRLIATMPNRRNAAASSSGGISGRSIHRAAGRATAVAPTVL